MSQQYRVAILSDIHYAGARERAVGDDYEYRGIQNPLLRFALRQYRRWIWLRYPLKQSGQLDRFLAQAPPVDLAIANGDFSCNTSALGVADDAAFESVQECLGKLRQRFPGRLQLVFGDHELGKLRLMGTCGGLRLRSWARGREELGIEPNWRVELGRHVLMGCTSTLIALPLFQADILPAEREAWEKLRQLHLAALNAAFAKLCPDQRVHLFCHDPSALPFLLEHEAIRSRLRQIDRTIVGHLHSNLYLRISRCLAGMPEIRCLGNTMRRMSAGVRQARVWRDFRVLLCPALAGIELLNDGGYLMAYFSDEESVDFKLHPLPRPRWR